MCALNRLFLKSCFVVLCCLSTEFVSGQNQTLDSLKSVLLHQAEDTNKVKTLYDYGLLSCRLGDTIIPIRVANETMTLAERLKFTRGKVLANDLLGEIFYFKHQDVAALKYFYESLRLAKEINDKSAIGYANRQIGWSYEELLKIPEALDFWNQSLIAYKEIHDTSKILLAQQHIGIVYTLEDNFPEADKSFKEYMRISALGGDKSKIANAKIAVSSFYSNLNKSNIAFQLTYDAMKIYEEVGNKYGEGQCKQSIGSYYFDLGDKEEALKCWNDAIRIREEIGDRNGMAQTYNSVGGMFTAEGRYEEALEKHLTALKIFQETGRSQLGVATSLASISLVYEYQGKEAIANGDQKLAEEKFNSSIAYLLEANEVWKKTEGNDIDGMIRTYLSLGRIYLTLKNYKKSRDYLNEALKNAIAHKFKNHTLTCYQTLSGLETELGNYKLGFEYYKNFITYRDSIFSQDNAKSLAQTRMNYDFDKKETAEKFEQEKKDALAQEELEEQKLIRNGTLAGLAIVLVFSALLFNRFRLIRKQKKIIEHEKERSEELLLNILPAETARELKEKGSTDARLFEEVTVLFTDFKGFTQIAEKLSPQELVAEIHYCFKAFDEIMEKFNIEKIKTIGDAYMAAGGLPVVNKTNATDVVLAALEIQAFILNYKLLRVAEGRQGFEIRIGIHTGPVVAGIVGIKKFAYDIWGDTVNTASRMESSGEAGKVNISGSTYDIVKDRFVCVHRGKIHAKNKGDIDMYFVDGVVGEFS